MSSDLTSDEIPVDVITENKDEPENPPADLTSYKNEIVHLTKQLDSEKQKSIDLEGKLKHVLADYQNLNKKTHVDIENGINSKIDEFILDFLKIHDDLVRAKEVFSENKSHSDGINSILTNMDSLLQKYDVSPIDALGELFDPNSHEAISVVTDLDLDENTITKEIRKGYISQKRVIRPSLVEISKKNDDEK